MATRDLDRLFEHLWWADAQVLSGLRSISPVPTRALELYAHILGAELVWLDRIEGAAQSVAVWPAFEAAECAFRADQSRKRYEAFLRELNDPRLPELIHYVNSAGEEFRTPLRDILVHVALHGAYHRGQIALLLRDAGHDPVPTDYIGYIRGRPAAKRVEGNDGDS